MIIADIEGLVMEKVSSDKQNSNEKKLQLRIFQRGNKDLVTATVSSKLFNAIKEGDKVAFKGKIDMWTNDGNFGMYCMEVFN